MVGELLQLLKVYSRSEVTCKALRHIRTTTKTCSNSSNIYKIAYKSIVIIVISIYKYEESNSDLKVLFNCCTQGNWARCF